MDGISLDTILNILTKVMVFIIAGSIHEFAHAASAYVLGDSTAKDSGRLSINPLVHVDPIGSILFPVIGVGIGWMKPVPVFLGNLKKPIRDHALIAFAGPFSNFMQACFAILLIKLISIFGVQKDLFYILQLYAYINMILMGFNMLPIPPLDGGAILRYFLPSRFHYIFDSISRFGFVILILLLFSGALRILFVPLTALFSALVSLDIIMLLLINLANIVLVSYFLKSIANYKIGQTAAVSAKSKIAYKKKEFDNTEYIKKANEIKSTIEEKGFLVKAELTKIAAIKKGLDAKANICPPDDYDIKDKTCTNCDWFQNCLVRYANSNVKK